MGRKAGRARGGRRVNIRRCYQNNCCKLQKRVPRFFVEEEGGGKGGGGGSDNQPQNGHLLAAVEAALSDSVHHQ